MNSCRVNGMGANCERYFASGLVMNPELTDREKEIIKLVAQGKRASEIADCLHLCVQTIKNHKNRIGQKLGFFGVNQNVFLTRYAIRTGLLKP